MDTQNTTLQIDPELYKLAQLVSRHENLAIPISLIVSGLEITGRLVSEAQYQRNLRLQTMEIDAMSLTRQVVSAPIDSRDALEQVLEQHRASSMESAKNWQIDEAAPIQYLHVRNSEDFWRIRLDAVSGFSADRVDVLPTPQNTKAASFKAALNSAIASGE